MSGNISVESLPTTDFREMDVLRFFFEIHHQKMDQSNLQQILLQHQLQKQQSTTPPSNHSFSSPVFKPKENNISTPENSHISNSVTIPAPKVIFQYVPSSPRYLTPSSSPEPHLSIEAASTNDYKMAIKKSNNFHIEDRCNFIQFKEDDKNQRLLMTPKSSIHDCESDHEGENNDQKKSQLPQLMSNKLQKWQGKNIYHNLPDIVMAEYDRVLRDSHSMKIEVVNNLNVAFPVNYEYNPKKSRIRTNYCDQAIADDRTKNNIASRRSRQRKKFYHQIIQYCVDFDDDENYLLRKQENWLRIIISNLENKILIKSSKDDDKIYKLRRQCGFD